MPVYILESNVRLTWTVAIGAGFMWTYSPPVFALDCCVELQTANFLLSASTSWGSAQFYFDRSRRTPTFNEGLTCTTSYPALIGSVTHAWGSESGYYDFADVVACGEACDVVVQSFDGSRTITFSVDADRVVECTEEEYELYANSPNHLTGRIYWLSHDGGNATVTIDGVVTSSETIDSVIELGEGITCGISDSLSGDLAPGVYRTSQSYSFTPSFMSANYSSVSPAVSDTETRNTTATSGAAMSASATISITNTMVINLSSSVPLNFPECTEESYANAIATCNATATWDTERTATINGVVRAMTEAYPSDLAILIDDKAGHTAEVTASGGVFSHSISQKSWSYSYTLILVESGSGSLNEFCPVTMRVKASSLAANGEAVADNRIAFRAWKWDSVSAIQAETVVVSDLWTDTPTDGEIERELSEANGADDSLIGDDWLYVSLRGYRYLLTGTPTADDEDGANYRISIDNSHTVKIWTHDKDGALLAIGEAQEIDLCNPNGTLDVDTKNSELPITIDGGGKESVEDTELWGVSQAISIKYLDLDDSKEYSFLELALRRTKTLLTALQVFNTYETPRSDSIQDTQWDIWLEGHTDGRRSLRLCSSYRYFQSGVWVYVPSTIEGVVDYRTSDDRPKDAFTFASLAVEPVSGCTDPVLPLSCYLHNGRSAGYLYGNGAIYQGESEAEGWQPWLYAIDIDISETVTLPAQIIVDTWGTSVGVPGWTGYSAGNVFGWEGITTGGSHPLDLRAAYIARGRVEGITHGQVNDSVADANVTITSGTYGTGTSDEEGIYFTGLPFSPLGTRTVKAEIGETPYPETDAAINPRQRVRISWRVVGTSEFRAIECDSVRSWLYIGVANRIRVHYATDAVFQFESEEYTDVDNWLRIRTDRRNDKVWLIGKEGDDTFRLCYTANFARTITEKFNVTARTSLCECLSSQSAIVWLYEDGATEEEDVPTTVQLRLSTDGGDTFAEAIECVMNDEEETPLEGELLDMTHDERQGNLLFLTIKIADDTKLLSSKNMGQVWEVVAS